MHRLLRFARRYLVRYIPWYIAGTAALAATNWIAVEIPLYLADGIDALAGKHPMAQAIQDAGIVAVLGLLVIGIRTASRLLFFTPGRLVEAQVKRDLFAAVLVQQPAFLERWPTGDLMSRATSDVNMIRLLAGFTALGILNTAVALILSGVQMFRISPLLAVITLAPLGVGFAVTQLFVRRLYVLMQRLQREAAALSDHILSSYQGAATVRAFNAEAAFQVDFEQRSHAWMDTTLKRTNIRTFIGPVLSLAASANVFLLLAVGGPMAIRGELSVGQLVAFTTLVGYLVGPLRGLSFILSLFKQAEASLERLEAVIDPPPDRPERADPARKPVLPSERPPALEVRDLTFSWPKAEAPALRGVTFAAAAGSTLGIFGATGSGKTTLLGCLNRLYNPPRGTVFVDGVDVLDLDLDAWRARVSYVPQRAFLFSESVRDNVLLGAPDDGRLEVAVRRAALDADLAALPQGLDTVVGESGLTLSGGQRQRVALARGLVRPCSVLVLDDVLSAVDHTTEQQLVAALREVGRSGARPTTVIVAHRISAIEHADRIVVLEDGAVVACGTHAELLAQPGPYRSAWERQNAGEAA